MQEKVQFDLYRDADRLISASRPSDAIAIMALWSDVQLNEFYLNYPHRYRILTYPSFKSFWVTRRENLNQRIGFKAQKHLSDTNFVLGYVFYLIALTAKKNEKHQDYWKYLDKAFELHSIHAAQMLLQEKVGSKEKSSIEKIATITQFLAQCEYLAKKHGTPGFLLLANGYLHVAKIAADLKDQDYYESACYELWRNLTLAELAESQSTNDIHNAYFGKGLALSNSFQLTSIAEMKAKASELIQDKTIKERAESRARSLFLDDKSTKNLQSWLTTKNRSLALAAKSDSDDEEEIIINPKIT